jgi:RNA polymerase sigma factor (sigma-70 family)
MSTSAGTAGRWRPAPFGLVGDERLAQRAGAGDERAFAVVYERYRQILYRYCRSILHDDADAEDALQSTFAAAFAALRAGQRDAPMRPWLFRIAHNESISVVRRRRPTFELSQAPDDVTNSIEDQVAERAELSVLVRDLHQLTDRQRSALVLRELSGLSHQEIAIALGTSVGAAKQTIFEARQSLFEFAEGRAMACDEIRRTISDADGRTLRSRRVRAHVRECRGCAAFAAAIPVRTGELRALAPALPASAAVGLLGRIATSAAGRGGGGLARLTAATAKTASAGGGFGANALAGAAVVATATAGVTIGLGHIVHATAHRDSGRAGRPATTLPPTRETAAASPSPILGGAPTRRAPANVMSRQTAPAAATTRASSMASVLRAVGSAPESRMAIMGGPGVARGSGNSVAPAQALTAPAATAYPTGVAWTGRPARTGSGESSSTGSWSQGKATNAGSTQPSSAGSGRQSGRPTEQRSGRPSQPGSQRSSRGGSGDYSSSASVQAGSRRSAAPSPVSASVNAPVTASGSATAGTVTKTAGAATKTAGTVTNPARTVTNAGSVTKTAGSVTNTVSRATSTVTGVLPVTSSASPPSTSLLPPVSRHARP